MNFFETLVENECCRFKLAIRRFESKLLCPYYTIPTNKPRAFHVETTWKRSFPRRFNVEYTWCICTD